MLDYDTSKLKQPIASGGLCAPRPTTGFSSLPQKILDPPLYTVQDDILPLKILNAMQVLCQLDYYKFIIVMNALM